MPQYHQLRAATSPNFIVAVDDDVIEQSCRKDSSHCMIADAVRRAYPDATRVSVDLQTVRFSVPKLDKRFAYLTPRSAQAALLAFDAGEKVPPFRFKLRNAHVYPMGGRRVAARIVPGDKTAGNPAPVRYGGDAPAIGQLPGGVLPASYNRQAGKPEDKGPVDSAGKARPPRLNDPARTGRRREYGLRAIVRRGDLD